MMDKQKLIADRLERITKRNHGVLTPDAVLADAQDESSPLHDQFTWDDTEAAHQWRLEQARTLIRSVRVEIQTETKTVSTVRYVRSPEAAGGEQGYADVMKIRTREDLSREALRRELAAARALFDRCETLAEAFGLRPDILDLQRRVAALNHRLGEPMLA